MRRRGGERVFSGSQWCYNFVRKNAAVMLSLSPVNRRLGLQLEHQQQQQRQQQQQQSMALAAWPEHTHHQQPLQPVPHPSPASECDWRQLTVALAAALLPWGLDIVHPFPLELYNAHCPEKAPELQPAFTNQGSRAAARSSTLAVVVGNSAAMWQPFLRQLAAQHHQPQQLLALQDPLDWYVQQHVTDAVQQVCRSHRSSSSSSSSATGERNQAEAAAEADDTACCAGLGYELRFSHESGHRFVNMMAAAQLSGLAYNSPTTHLCWHPLHGPWFALRALVAFECEGPAASSIHQLPCPHPDLEAEAATRMQSLQQLGGLANWKQHWREWADLRALGGRHTHPRHVYSQDQLQYHYTKSKEVLVRAVTRLWEQEQPQEQQQEQEEQLQQHRRAWGD